MVHLCFGGKAAGGSFEVDDLSSACRATKSLYRLLTVQVRIGVDTDDQLYSSQGASEVPGMTKTGARLTLDCICGMRFRLCHYLSRSNYYILYITHFAQPFMRLLLYAGRGFVLSTAQSVTGNWNGGEMQC